MSRPVLTIFADDWPRASLERCDLWRSTYHRSPVDRRVAYPRSGSFCVPTVGGHRLRDGRSGGREPNRGFHHRASALVSRGRCFSCWDSACRVCAAMHGQRHRAGSPLEYVVCVMTTVLSDASAAAATNDYVCHDPINGFDLGGTDACGNGVFAPRGLCRGTDPASSAIQPRNFWESVQMGVACR